MLSSAALVQLNHSVMLIKIIVLVKGKEAVSDTSVIISWLLFDVFTAVSTVNFL